jgi:predicted nucleic acid-binding protein
MIIIDTSLWVHQLHRQGDSKNRARVEEWMNDEIWEQACDLAHRCRRQGKTATFAAILIAACARHHKIEVAHDDAHFDFLMTLWR